MYVINKEVFVSSDVIYTIGYLSVNVDDFCRVYIWLIWSTVVFCF